ncbi:MAG TPA: mandelate racemase/muconate lactonizing enzyme family protein [Bacteroidales bacterium]|nr:mandelate racemase/muconate lactonizing enzyme family protein [Bacteroidales bacterium]HPJ60374.1 mandelate racemase/muconate lactonizing enzyme family protein [Bacteroidales bacterium]HPR12594.1 mandelate racemase/muconate lactonizing enzyme family protein [Bacteroidales bacterium]HRW86729.1 mandelate racemase/muconate lactonizing enzyme family protein [Bacteroidales bacterium]
MKTNRREFISLSLAAGIGSALPGCSRDKESMKEKYMVLDGILKKSVLKTEFFPDPVIIDNLELLRLKDTFLCRVRSKDGAEGISVANNDQMKSLWPVFINRLQPFFPGKDARSLEKIIDDIYVYQSNYKMQNLALWVPLATIEFAILDMLGKIAGKSTGQLIGTIHNPEISVYQANGERGISAELTVEHLLKEVGETKAKALKFKVGGRMSNNYESPAGRSEKLIPLVRKTFGDKMVIYADSNGSYTADEAIRIGKIMEEYKIDFYEEPVPFDWYEETKEVAGALDIPIAGGEQEPSLHSFRWLIANDALQIVQPDVFYFGGMIRSMKVAMMAEALGKVCTPHISGSGLGYLYMMHFVSAIPNAGPYHEFKGFNKSLPFTCETSPLASDEGIIKVPAGPGMGIDIDPDYIGKHSIISVT